MRYDFVEFFLKDLYLNGLFAQYFGADSIENEAMWAIANFSCNVMNMKIGLIVYDLKHSAYPDEDVELNKINLETLNNIFTIEVNPSIAGEDGWILYKQPPGYIPVYISENLSTKGNHFHRKPIVDLSNTKIPLEIGNTTICKTWVQLITYGAIARVPYKCNFEKIMAVWFILDESCGLYNKIENENYELLKV